MARQHKLAAAPALLLLLLSLAGMAAAARVPGALQQQATRQLLQDSADVVIVRAEGEPQGTVAQDMVQMDKK
jgi:hypothetical protein